MLVVHTLTFISVLEGINGVAQVINADIVTEKIILIEKLKPCPLQSLHEEAVPVGLLDSESYKFRQMKPPLNSDSSGFPLLSDYLTGTWDEAY